MLADIGHPVFARRAGLRHHVRERPGRRADQPPVPPRQPQRRLRRRHRRPERAGARLEHLRRRRPHVALQRQRQRAEDADQAPGPLGRGERLGRARRRSGARRDPRHPDQPRAGAGRRPTDAPVQSSEDAVGPYELQDFHLYHDPALRLRADQGRLPRPRPPGTTRAGGEWPDGPDVRAQRLQRSPRSRRTCGTFLYRFFKTSQFKRSCMPNAPKVGSGGSLSPRGDWRAPSDSEATVWLDDVERIPENEDPASA